MIERSEGPTKLYNRFHDREERDSGIQALRDQHHAMHRAVLQAYGFGDLAERAVPRSLDATTEPDHRYHRRLFWPVALRDEILARLLDLNLVRAEEERELGLSAGRGRPKASDPVEPGDPA